MFSVSSQPPRSINLNVKPLLATTRLTPVPSQPLIHNLSPTTSNPFQDWKQNQILDNATAIFWNALNPRPLRSLELGDIERSTECLEIWEEHDEKGFGVLADLRGVRCRQHRTQSFAEGSIPGYWRLSYRGHLVRFSTCPAHPDSSYGRYGCVSPSRPGNPRQTRTGFAAGEEEGRVRLVFVKSSLVPEPRTLERTRGC